VLDLPLGETTVAEPSVMVNLLGVSDQVDFEENYPELMKQFATAKLHTYGKSPRIGRKLGHITVVGGTQESALDTALKARAAIMGVL
jgi:5-(carboxyamino)imidazole ribonucleotide synthase